MLNNDKPPSGSYYNISGLAPNIGSFLTTVLFAIIFKWRAEDVIWGLWVCSLTFGYIWLLLFIFQIVIKSKPSERKGAVFLGAFFLAFFTFHFGVFHLVHGAFLTHFFPIGEIDFFKNGPLVIFFMAGAAVAKGWPLILGTFISRWKSLPIHQSEFSHLSGMLLPYVNVVRMHLLIFIFAGLSALGLDHLALFPILGFYYFPWEIIKKPSFLKMTLK